MGYLRSCGFNAQVTAVEDDPGEMAELHRWFSDKDDADLMAGAQV